MDNMSKAISIRLPDQLLLDVQAYARSNGVSVTDVIISGLQAILQPVNTMPGTEIVAPGASGETVYVPDPVSPVKQPKQSASKQAAPIVKAMLAGLSKRPTATHHPQCTCAMCKDAA